MKYVSELYGKHQGEDIYVVGTAPSIRVFPSDFFEGKTVIGLNMAWKNVRCEYGITIHPDLNIPEFMEGELPRPEIKWITGHKKSKALLNPEQLAHAEREFYFFEYHGKPNTQPPDEPSDSGRIIDWVRRPTGNCLYVWSSIAQAGANLAANMGAKNVIMVGCDNAPLGANHHAHLQHTRWKGVDPDHRYRQYYEGLAEVRAVLRERNVNLVNMNPFLKLDAFEEDFSRLCKELGKQQEIRGVDVSPRDPKLKAFSIFRKMHRFLVELK